MSVPAGRLALGRGVQAVSCRTSRHVLADVSASIFEAPVWFLKRESGAGLDTLTTFGLDEEDAYGRIRCPLCGWRPGPSSLWCCTRVDAPEGFSGGCGTVWNTFSTRGRCPGCQHRWRWTKCLRCDGWSLHDDWYEQEDDPR